MLNSGMRTDFIEVIWREHLRTLTCPVEGREFPKIPVNPFDIFGNGEESEPFTWGGSGGGGGGGGDCVMNWENGARINGVMAFIFGDESLLGLMSLSSPLSTWWDLVQVKSCGGTCVGDMSPFWLSTSQGDSWGTALRGESWLVGWSGERASLLSSSRDELSPPAPFGESERREIF